MKPTRNHPISFPESADSGTLGTRLGSTMFKVRLEAVRMSCVLSSYPSYSSSHIHHTGFLSNRAGLVVM